MKLFGALVVLLAVLAMASADPNPTTRIARPRDPYLPWHGGYPVYPGGFNGFRGVGLGVGIGGLGIGLGIGKVGYGYPQYGPYGPYGGWGYGHRPPHWHSWY